MLVASGRSAISERMNPCEGDDMINVRKPETAIAFYKSQGFVVEDSEPVQMGPYHFEDYVMVRPGENVFLIRTCRPLNGAIANPF
jgi:hypothetical protein